MKAGADHRGAVVASVVALALLLTLLAAPGAQALPRATSDRPDDLATPNQVHAIYALPADGADHSLDTNGTVAATVGAWQGWLRGQTGGKGLTLDTAAGELDVTFARLPSSDAALASEGLFIRDRIERELRGLGVLEPRKLYAVYYDGSADGACGGAPWPQSADDVASTGQQVAAFYLQGRVPGAPDCGSHPFANAGQPPGYKEFAALHELIHGLGVVPTCAPNHTLAGHVSDSPADLMYAGDQPWQPTTLDVGRDDYFNAGVPGCLDLAESKYLEGNGDPGAGPKTKKRRGPKRKISKRKATFRFSSPTADSFECRLDREDWEECESPAKVKRLSRGKHKFFARAIDGGLADATPAVWKFKVSR